MNKQQALHYIASSYIANFPNCGMQKVFDKLKEEYDSYQKTGDKDTLRYLLALCIRIRHGRRMPWKYTRMAVDTFIEYSIFEHVYEQFSDIYSDIGKLFKDILFARGPLTLYDTALDIGHLLSTPVEPDYNIYLNAGAWSGAVYLKGKKNIASQMSVSAWQTPDLFPNLRSMYIEDILCIFKDIFKKLSKVKSVTQNEIDQILEKCSKVSFPEKDVVLRKMNYISK